MKRATVILIAFVMLSGCAPKKTIAADTYEDGYKSGYEYGREDGYRDGYDAGYENGKIDGYQACLDGEEIK